MFYVKFFKEKKLKGKRKKERKKERREEGKVEKERIM